MNFQKYITSQYSHNELADIANHGCSGGVSGLIYYTELKQLYREYAGDIHEIIGQWCDETGEKYPECVAKELGCFDMFVSAVVWFAVEWIAYQQTQGEYIEEVSTC